MCGIVGVIHTPDAAREAFLALTTLQHRGQDAAGILTHDSDGFHRVTGLGLVEAVFNRDNMDTLTGRVAIGHARYSTAGRGDLGEVQPLLINYPYGMGMIHNGNIVNARALKKELQEQAHRHLLSNSDTEAVLNLLAENLAQDKSPQSKKSLSFDMIVNALKVVHEKAIGSYSIVTMIAGHGLLAFRDPNGIRPLIWGQKENADGSTAHMFASESVALLFNGYEVVRDLQPGEAIWIDLAGKTESKVIGKREHRPCMFEWVYFASPESVVDGSPVYGARIGLGRGLAKLVRTELKKRNLEADVVVPVPETARIAAIALSEELGIPYRETLIKNRYIKRTFILDSQEKRKHAVSLKLSPVRSEMVGKRVILVDDSIVRGTTSQKLVELVRQAGAKAVYFVSTCPPIQNPCYYGIDFPNRDELIAAGKSREEIEKALGADLVVYQDLEELREAVWPNAQDRPCMACLDGKYPTDITAAAEMTRARREDRRRGPS